MSQFHKLKQENNVVPRCNLSSVIILERSAIMLPTVLYYDPYHNHLQCNHEVRVLGENYQRWVGLGQNMLYLNQTG